MGDLQVCTPPLPKPIDCAPAGHSSQPSHQPNPNPSPIGATMWRQAELATQEIIKHIRPTVVSEQRRKAVVEYVQKLIRGFVSSEVFPFGSVPLKTYLPDGDIDLTAIGIPSSEDALASDVRSILEGEEHNNDSEFEVKDVQYIQAEVKLVKCLVQNIVVDISFNQIGGLCTLCFLEQVDRFIGKEHLFKRSIILIKAWCYYESRILGAHHGLISTYALETLVLYIFHLFHSSLDGPLAVLYRFLDYYSKFDWDKYCISLHGPVSLSSLPELAVEAFDNDGGDLLLTEEFLKSCVDTFSVPVRGSENNSRTFNKKHLNIVDPLRKSNNLGRSVSKGNFYRIRSAFTYGARKLERLLLLPAGCIGDEVHMFFMNTMDRHGGGERPDVQDLVPRSLSSTLIEANGFGFVPSVDKLEKEPAYKLMSESPTAKSYRDLNEEMKNVKISGCDDVEGRTQLQKSLSYKQKNSTKMEPNGEVIGVSSGRLIGDAKDLATVRTSALGSLTESSKALASTKEDGVLDFRKAHHAPHLVFRPEYRTRNGLKLDQVISTSLDASCNVPLARDLSSNEEVINSKHPDSCETDSSLNSRYWPGDFGNASPSQCSISVDCVGDGNSINGPSASLNEMSDLSGDYEMHFNSLNYALWCHEQTMSSYFLPMHRSPQYSFYHHSKDVWPRGSMFTHINSSLLSPRPPFSPAARYSVNQPFLSGSYNVDDVPKTRGTGTYFPNTNYHGYRERHSPGRVKNAVSVNHMPRPQTNGHADISHDMSSVEKVSHEPGIHAQPVLGGNGRGGLLARLDIPQWSSRPTAKSPANVNGILFPPEFGGLEFGSLGPVSVEAPAKEHVRRLEVSIPHSQPFGFASSGSSSRRSAINSNNERKLQSYQLKDEEDFPPLSG